MVIYMFAGLSDKVEVVNGILTDKIDEVKRMVKSQGQQILDFVFIDHDKNFYLSDMLLLKENGLLGKGTILFADNMRIPGSPKYREFMNTHKDEYDTVETKTSFEYLSFLPDSVLVSICK
jgi:catechol O-methyltransferase